MGDEKVDVAVLRTLLTALKEKLNDLYKGQADFLKEWPGFVSRITALETQLKAQDQKLQDYIEAQRFSWTTIIAVCSLIMALGLIVVEIYKH